MEQAPQLPTHPFASPEARFHWILTRMVRIAVPIHIGLAAFFLWLGLPTMAWASLVSIASYAGVHALLRRQRARDAFALGATQLLLFNALATLAMGWSSSFHLYLLLLPILFVLHPNWPRPLKAGACIALCAAYGLLALHAYLTGAVTAASTAGAGTLGAFNALTFATTLSFLAFTAGKATGDAEDGLRQATETLAELSSRDTLTGLLNRRATHDLLRTAHTRMRRLGEPYSIAMVDLDHFKRINDQHGHACGDAVLESVAGALAGALRDTDHVARWGGEEFLILLANTTPTGAQHAAYKLLESVRACRIDCPHDQELEITASIGIATSTPTRSLESTVNAADEALYTGKRTGRNRITTHDVATPDTATVA